MRVQNQLDISQSPTKYKDDDFEMGIENLSDDFIEIDCAVVDQTSNDNVCKVCWSNEQSDENPLLNSCKCDGSVRFIHFDCLKQWLRTKM